MSDIAYIPLKGGQVTIVDAEDFKFLNQWKWHVDNFGYVRRSIKGTSIKMHRVVNQTLKGFATDHINGNKLDNRKVNLRTCTQGQNTFNRKLNKDNKSGHKGVCLRKFARKWVAQIGFQGRKIHIGSFDDPLLAALAYQAKASELFGNFNYKEQA